MFKRFAVIALLACASVAAFAIPKPSEIKAAVESGNYAKAESMLMEVMKEKPSARAHYDLGQVYTFEGKHGPALNEFRQAQALDPSLKFASSAAEFTKKLATAQTMVAPPPVVVAQVQAAPPPSTVTYSVPAVPTTYAATPAKSDSGSVVPIILIVLLIGGVAGGAFFVITRKKEDKDIEDRATAARREKNSTLLGFSKSLEDAVLIAKTATYGDVQRRQILDRIATLQTQTRSMLADLKDNKEVTAGRIATLESNVSIAVDQANNGIPAAAPAPIPESAPVVTAQKPVENIREPGVDAYTLHSSLPPVPQPRVVHNHYHNTPAPAPIVVNNSNDGLVTGMVLGSMMNNHHDRIVEREVIVERTPRRDSYDDAPRYVAPPPAPRYVAPAPTFDSSDDKDDYQAAAPAMDTASDDNDSY
jgi:hypothetical protein